MLSEICADLKVDLSIVNEDEIGLMRCAEILSHKYDCLDYDKASGRIMSHIIFESCCKTIEEYTSVLSKVLNKRTIQFMISNKERIMSEISKYKHLDDEYGWLSISSIYHNYLLKKDYKSKPCENIGFMWMRISIDIFAEKGIEEVIRAFVGMRTGKYIPASPFMYSAGTKKNQHRSCFLWSINDDLHSILEHGVLWTGLISKMRGGCGFDVSRLRNSEISNVGFSNGVMPWLKVYDTVPKAVNQSGKRDGAITVHMRSHHINLIEAISSMLNTGHVDNLIKNIQLSVMFSWLFWERVKNDGTWTLFCPAITKKLNDVYGLDFEKAYLEYEKDEELMLRSKTLKARDILMHMCSVQVRSSLPYVINHDSANFKSNHRHMGMIRSLNLCLEIVEHFKEGEIASCNLHSVSLKFFARSEYIKKEGATVQESLLDCYDFNSLGETCRQCVKNLDSSIDVSVYPIPDRMIPNNERNRPLSIGVSGLADAIYMLDLSYERKETRMLNKMIFACMYYNSLCESVALAIKYGQCEGHKGSPASEGKLQFDLWKEEYDLLYKKGRINSNVRTKEMDEPLDPKCWGQKRFVRGDLVIEPSWESLKSAIKKYGLRNTLLIGLMPTATSSQPLGNCETVEPPQSNIYLRKLVSGNFPVLNKYMVKDLMRLNLWNSHVIDLLIADEGSLNLLPKFIQEHPHLFNTYINEGRLDWVVKKYKTTWELSQKLIIDMTADRARYVDQSMSTNFYMRDPSNAELASLIRYCFDHGLKTVMYYLRMSPKLKRPDSSINHDVSRFLTKHSISRETSTKRTREISCESCQ